MPDAARYAQQSDPEFNRHFRRLWNHPLADLPAPVRLDREADAELALGHHAAAERLARRAEVLRVFGPDSNTRLDGGGR